MSGRIDDGGGWADCSASYDLGESWEAPEAVAETAPAIDDAPVYGEAECDAPRTPEFGLPDNEDARAYLADNACTAESLDTPWQDTPAPGARTVVVGQGQGVLQALGSAGVADKDLHAAYGSLVSSGQLRAEDFRNGSPIVQPGRQFEVDEGSLTDGNAKLGRRLIGAEGKARIAEEIEAIHAVTRPNDTQRAADPNRQLVLDSMARQARAAPAPAPAAPAPSVAAPFAKSYDTVLETWRDFKQTVRADNEAIALQDQGGALTATVAVIQGPRDLGFALVDSGLALGQVASHVALSTYDSLQAGTLQKDVRAAFGPAAHQVAEALSKMDTVRVSVSYDDYKAMVGTDRVGVQYKGRGGIDEVTRLTYAWGADTAKTETVLEKNLADIKVPVKLSAMGVPVDVKLVPGLRQNLSGSHAVTPSLNLDFGATLPARTEEGKPAKLKFSVELRQSGS